MSASMLFEKPNWGWVGQIVTCTVDFFYLSAALQERVKT